nr:Uma2 family endonuclease [Thermus caldifontis]
MAQGYRFGIEEFERLFRGVTGVELLEGEVYQMSPIGPRHAEVVARLVTRFAQALGDKAPSGRKTPCAHPPSRTWPPLGPRTPGRPCQPRGHPAFDGGLRIQPGA